MTKRISRRRYLHAMAAATGAAALSRTSSAAEAEPAVESGYIDAHVHVWTSDIERYPLADGMTKENMNPPSFTPEELFRHTKDSGVTRVNLIQMSYYGFDNAYMLDMMERYPGTFAGTAIVDPFGLDPAAEMLRLAAQKCYAFRIQPSHSKEPPESWLQPEPMDILFATAAAHNLALSALIRLDGLPEVERMCAKYPDAPVIIDHLNLIATGDSWPVQEEHIAAIRRLSRHKNVYMKVGAFYALGDHTPTHVELLPVIQLVVEAFTPQRCMWESDSPFQMTNHTYDSSIALIRDHADFLSPSDKNAILRDTAARLLFRDNS